MDPEVVEKYIGAVEGLLSCLKKAAASGKDEDWVDVGYCEVAVAHTQCALDLEEVDHAVLL